jgi:hypothetical protein
VTQQGLDAEGVTLLRTHSGEALGALGNAAHAPAAETRVPEDARIYLEVLAVVASNASADGTSSNSPDQTSEAVTTGCTRTLVSVQHFLPYCRFSVLPTHCYWRTTCKYPTESVSHSYYTWTCC